MKKYSLLLIGFVVFFSACKPEMDVPQPSAGNANFSKYIAIGNSLTSGYADGALYQSGQENSYPNMLAGQMKLVGGASTFTTPYTNSVNGSGSDGSGKRQLGYAMSCDSVYSLSPLATAGDLGIFASNIYSTQGPFQNLGVPGCKAVHFTLAGYGDPTSASGFNPYYARFASSTTASLLEDALANQPTFFTYWLGSNDVLFYGLGGAEGSTDGFGTYDMTPKSTFESVINGTFTALDNAGAKGVVANVPDITSVPYFTTIPWNGLYLDSTNAAFLTLITGQSFSAGYNGFLINDDGVTRKMVAGELLLLNTPQDSIRCAFWGSAKPITGNYVITQNELTVINARIADFNQILSDRAAEHGFAYCDMNAYLKQFTSGIVYDGVRFDARFVQGGAFSLDGIHPNPKGYAMCANNFIKTINSFYGSSLPPVQVNDYPGIIFP